MGESVGDAVGLKAAGEVAGASVGDAVGLKVVGEVVGVAVVGEVVGDRVGAEIVGEVVGDEVRVDVVGGSVQSRWTSDCGANAWGQSKPSEVLPAASEVCNPASVRGAESTPVRKLPYCHTPDTDTSTTTDTPKTSGMSTVLRLVL